MGTKLNLLNNYKHGSNVKFWGCIWQILHKWSVHTEMDH